MSKRPNSFALRANLLLLRISRNWLRVTIGFLAIYVALPVIAPTMMHLGLESSGRALYTLYSPFCHQFAFRSLFLFGEQPAYPRFNTGSPLRPFEAYAEQLPEFDPSRIVPPFPGPVGDVYAFTPGFQGAAREFLGNPQMGYKMTLCARDIAIYSAMLVGAVLYARIGRRVRPVPIWLYVLLGLGPIGLDGFSQLLGYPPFNLWPPRETLPGYRVVTGALFGLMNVWLGFPYLQMSFDETREAIEAKLQRAGIRA